MREFKKHENSTPGEGGWIQIELICASLTSSSAPGKSGSLGNMRGNPSPAHAPEQSVREIARMSAMLEYNDMSDRMPDTKCQIQNAR